MDKNTLTGILLIGAIFIAFLFLNQEEKEPADNQAISKVDEVIEDVKNEKKIIDSLFVDNEENQEIKDSSYQHYSSDNSYAEQISAKKEKYGLFYKAIDGEEEIQTLENDKIRVRLTNKGGRLVDVCLIEENVDGGYKYKTHTDFVEGNNVPIKLFEGESYKQSLTLKLRDEYDDQYPVETSQFYFQKIKSNDSSLVYKLYSEDSSKAVLFKYELLPGQYNLDYSIEYLNLENDIDLGNVNLNWSLEGLSTEKLASDERMICTIMYRCFGEGRDYLSERSDDQEKIKGELNWIAFKHKFFSSILISEEGLNGNIEQHQIADDRYTIKYNANVILPPKRTSNFKFYFGPNEYELLSSYEMEMEDIINLGWGIFRWVNNIMIEPIFNLIKSTGMSFGIIILLVTLIVKLIILPLTYKNYKSTAKMRVLKPEIDKINQKYEGKSDKDLMMKKQKETMALYKKTGVNPMSGCIPMLIQMPILLAVFKFFPSSLDLRHQGFLWAEDLSSYDAIVTWTTEIPILSSLYGNHISLFTLLMAISTLFYTLLNSSQMNTSQPGMPNMKVIMYIFPIMMLFFFNTYSSGLSYYYLCGNLMNLGIMWAIKKYMIDEDKIKLQIEENKKKPKKKSKFQQRMEQMSKQQQLKKR